jgi:uncharacterized membrane protein YdbT with pleckstrin-like domain
MYSAFRQFCERVLRIPPQPEPPPGDEKATQIFRAAPNFYKYLLALWALKTAFSLLILAFVLIGPLVAVSTGHTRIGNEWKVVIVLLEGVGLLIAIGGALLALALVRLDFEQRWYLVTDRSLRVREGIAQVREATVTFANIQNISISQGPLQRVLGIADLRVDTAGGGGTVQGKTGQHNAHAVWFRGVNNANEIKELMQQRLRRLKDSGLGDHEELTAQPLPTLSANLLVALREVRAEAAALRAAAASLNVVAKVKPV